MARQCETIANVQFYIFWNDARLFHWRHAGVLSRAHSKERGDEEDTYSGIQVDRNACWHPPVKGAWLRPTTCSEKITVKSGQGVTACYRKICGRQKSRAGLVWSNSSNRRIGTTVRCAEAVARSSASGGLLTCKGEAHLRRSFQPCSLQDCSWTLRASFPWRFARARCLTRSCPSI